MIRPATREDSSVSMDRIEAWLLTQSLQASFLTWSAIRHATMVMHMGGEMHPRILTRPLSRFLASSAEKVSLRLSSVGDGSVLIVSRAKNKGQLPEVIRQPGLCGLDWISLY